MGLLNFLFNRIDSLDAYTEYIQRCLQNGTSGIIPNSSSKHAAVIIQEFTKAARREIHIFCGHLSYSVYGNLISLFKDAFDKNIDVKVVVFDAKVDDCSLALAQLLKEKSSIRSLQGSFPTSVQDVPHFAIFDGTPVATDNNPARYRFEISDTDKRAIVSLSARDTEDMQRVSKMNSIFDILWKSATELKIKTSPKISEG